MKKYRTDDLYVEYYREAFSKYSSSKVGEYIGQYQPLTKAQIILSMSSVRLAVLDAAYIQDPYGMRKIERTLSHHIHIIFLLKTLPLFTQKDIHHLFESSWAYWSEFSTLFWLLKAKDIDRTTTPELPSPIRIVMAKSNLRENDKNFPQYLNFIHQMTNELVNQITRDALNHIQQKFSYRAINATLQEVIR